MKLTIGFSPCPNDTFIFDALVNSKMDAEGIEWEPVLADVQTLNEWANEGKLDVTKLSVPALFRNLSHYVILNSGAALGKGVGPLLVARSMVNVPDVRHARIAIPGEQTTANFLLTYLEPLATNRKSYLFSDIEDAVVKGEADLGLIIHENRFTYQQKGLIRVIDLGEYWEKKTGSALPLGCIAIRRNIEPAVQKKVDELIRKSLVIAFNDYPSISSYVKSNAQAMDEAVMRKHIELYVNDFSLDLGAEGKKAIAALYKVYCGDNSPGNLSLFCE
jgi:1,4-dihydroxy-6-naphthoate synthase